MLFAEKRAMAVGEKRLRSRMQQVIGCVGGYKYVQNCLTVIAEACFLLAVTRVGWW